MKNVSGNIYAERDRTKINLFHKDCAWTVTFVLSPFIFPIARGRIFKILNSDTESVVISDHELVCFIKKTTPHFSACYYIYISLCSRRFCELGGVRVNYFQVPTPDPHLPGQTHRLTQVLGQNNFFLELRFEISY